MAVGIISGVIVIYSYIKSVRSDRTNRKDRKKL